MKFYIMNDYDKPCERMVVQRVAEYEGEYIHESEAGGGLVIIDEDSTQMEDFGFLITYTDEEVHFIKVRPSVARYKDPQMDNRYGIRKWQSDVTDFTLKLHK